MDQKTYRAVFVLYYGDEPTQRDIEEIVTVLAQRANGNNITVHTFDEEEIMNRLVQITTPDDIKGGRDESVKHASVYIKGLFEKQLSKKNLYDFKVALLNELMKEKQHGKLHNALQILLDSPNLALRHFTPEAMAEMDTVYKVLRHIF
jgi:hypothetical protein